MKTTLHTYMKRLKEYKWYIIGVLLMVALYFLRYWIAYILLLLSLGIFRL